MNKKKTKKGKTGLKLVVDQSKVRNIAADEVKQRNKLKKANKQERKKRQAHGPHYSWDKDKGNFVTFNLGWMFFYWKYHCSGICYDNLKYIYL